MTNYTGEVKFWGEVQASDLEGRTVSGVIVTFGEEGYANGRKVRFAPGSLKFPTDLNEVRLQKEHDRTQPLGRMLSVEENENTVTATFSVIKTTAGDDALLEASEGLRNGFSVGGRIIKAKKVGDVLELHEVQIEETSLVTFPALSSSRVESIAASEETPEVPEESASEILPEKEETMTEVINTEVVEASVEKVVNNLPAATSRPMPGIGEIISAAYQRVSDPAAWGRIEAALATQVLADNPGVVPTPIVGPVVDTFAAERKLTNLFAKRPLPAAGSSFNRPKIAQWTLAGEQLTELAELASQDMQIDPIEVSKRTVGGAIKISVQNRDWTDPAILGILSSDLIRQTFDKTEALVAVALEAGITQTEDLALNADPDVVTAAIYAAAEQVIDSIGDTPNFLLVSPDQWARLGALSGTDLRPIFPTYGASNAPGVMGANSMAANPYGLPLVVSRHLSAGTIILGNSNWFETYESGINNLQLPSPSTLSFDLAYYLYFATAMLEAGAFVKIEPAA